MTTWRDEHSGERDKMPNKKKVIGPLPDSFASEEEAGEFWDTHSLADYEEFREPADVTFDIQERVFEVRVAEDIFQKLQARRPSVASIRAENCGPNFEKGAVTC